MLKVPDERIYCIGATLKTLPVGKFTVPSFYIDFSAMQNDQQDQ